MKGKRWREFFHFTCIALRLIYTTLISGLSWRGLVSRSNLVTTTDSKQELESRALFYSISQNKPSRISQICPFSGEMYNWTIRPACLSKHIRNVLLYVRKSRSADAARDSHVFVTSTEGIAAARAERVPLPLNSPEFVLARSAPKSEFPFLLLMRQYEFYRALRACLRALARFAFLRA